MVEDRSVAPATERSRSRSGDERAYGDPDDEVVDEVSQESFPASDSPSWWSGPPTASR